MFWRIDKMTNGLRHPRQGSFTFFQEALIMLRLTQDVVEARSHQRIVGVGFVHKTDTDDCLGDQLV